MPGVFKLCASCLGYDALQRAEETKEDAEEAVMLQNAGEKTTKARMGILKIKKREEENAEVEDEKEAVMEGQKEGLLQCKTGEEDEEEEEGDSGACVDEFPVNKDAEEGGGEAEKAAVSSGNRDEL